MRIPGKKFHAQRNLQTHLHYTATFALCYADPRSNRPVNQEVNFVIVPLNEYDFLKRALVVHANKEAVVCGDLRLTYREFGERVNRWANAMRALGVEKGDRVAI